MSSSSSESGLLVAGCHLLCEISLCPFSGDQVVNTPLIRLTSIVIAGLALNLVAGVVDVRQILAIFTNAGGVVVHKRLVQFILDMQRPAESVLSGSTHYSLGVNVRVFGGFARGVGEQALAVVKRSISSVSTSVGHKRCLISFEQCVHSLLLLMEHAPILAGSILLMRSNRLVELLTAKVAV